jgi:hypothetical protein
MAIRKCAKSGAHREEVKRGTRASFKNYTGQAKAQRKSVLNDEVKRGWGV